MKLLFDESLSPRLVELLSDLFPDSQSALRNGLTGVGDLRILEYASAGDFVRKRDYSGAIAASKVRIG
jgi:predicted nuclease of predicted toxin-antitoxin system